MTTNEKIAIWLNHEHIYEDIWMNPITHANYWIDFLHDRNQQKWIIDEIIKRGYGIEMVYLLTSKEWNIAIYNSHMEDVVGMYCEDFNKALIQAVKQLIDKENKEEK